MKNNEADKAVGRELAERLRRFTEQLGAIDKAAQLPGILTVRTVKRNLQPRAFAADEVKQVRNALRVSQAVFANFLGISVATLRDWEQGVNKPTGPMCRLLEEILRDVPAWVNRIRELSNPAAKC